MVQEKIRILRSEEDRLQALHQLEVLDSNSDDGLDRIVRLAGVHFDAPFAYVSLMDRTTQQMKCTYGFLKEETPREKSFCTHTIEAVDVLVVSDTLADDRFKNNPAVTGNLKVRFYAGAPIVTCEGFAIGALCVMDSRPRSDLTEKQRKTLQEMAEMVMAHIELRRTLGRVNVLSGMPNEYQLEEDLYRLPSKENRGKRILVHIDIPDPGTAMAIAGVLGVDGYHTLMRNVAHKIKKICYGKADTYHLSDNQFGLLSKSDDTGEFRKFVQGLHKLCGDPVESANIPLNLLGYAGLTEFSIDTVNPPDVMRRALAAAHQAFIRKLRWCDYDASCDISLQRSFMLLTDIQSAIRAGDFRLEYQPKLNLRNGKYESVEALLRWNHKQLGAISPAEFIPLVEKTALIRPLTDWVLDTALGQMKKWKEQGLYLKVAINFSPKNFEENDICERIERACRRHGISAHEFEIECTEGVWMDSPDVLETLNQIRRGGIKIALDDFGTGYSNFAYLQEVPATIIKIDRSLIGEVNTNPRASRIVRSLIKLAKDLQYTIVAEGVEDLPTLQLMEKWNVDEVQGYLLSRPLVPDAIEKFVLQSVPFPYSEEVCI